MDTSTIWAIIMFVVAGSLFVVFVLFCILADNDKTIDNGSKLAAGFIAIIPVFVIIMLLVVGGENLLWLGRLIR